MCSHRLVQAEKRQTLKRKETPQSNRTNFSTRSLDPTSPVGALKRGLCKLCCSLIMCLTGCVGFASVCMLGYCFKEENLEPNSDDQGNDFDRLNIICIKEEDPEDDDYLCKAAGHIGSLSVTPLYAPHMLKINCLMQDTAGRIVKQWAGILIKKSSMQTTFQFNKM